jgi:hypothetical protein
MTRCERIWSTGNGASTPHVAVHDWEALGVFHNQNDRTLYLHDELRTQSEPAFLIPQRCFLEFAVQRAEELRFGSFLEMFVDRSLRFVPRHYIVGVCLVIRNSSVELSPLSVGYWDSCAVRSDAVPDLFHQRQTIFNAEAVNAERLDRNRHERGT